MEREKQERERSQRLKETGLAAVALGGSGWKAGGGGGGTSWAGKIAANSGSSPAVNRANPPSGGGGPWSSANGSRWVNVYGSFVAGIQIVYAMQLEVK